MPPIRRTCWSSSIARTGRRWWRSSSPTSIPELLTYLDGAVREEVLEQLGPAQAGAAIAQLETDDAIEILEDLDVSEQMALLATLPMPERAAVEAGLAYPEESAGRLMQRDFVAVPEFWTVGQTIDYLRANPDLPDDFYDLYIINPRFEPVGSIPLSKVLRSKRGVLLTELTHEGAAPCSGRGWIRRRSASCSASTVSCRRRWSTPTAGCSA